MFERLDFDASAPIAAAIVFALTFAVFVFIVIRTLRMSRHQVNKQAMRPLELDQVTQPNPPSDKK